jgi:hypothetical protein
MGVAVDPTNDEIDLVEAAESDAAAGRIDTVAFPLAARWVAEGNLQEMHGLHPAAVS